MDEFDKDYTFSFWDLSTTTPRSAADASFPYNIEDINAISDHLGIPWERSKDLPFTSITTFIGLQWDLDACTVGLGPKKIKKYIEAINEWGARRTHNLCNIQKLYGKLLQACLVVPAG
jgi:hypothetical protein